jgi:hypothetical protein
MERPSERRSPERQPHTLRLLRRLSVLALVASVVLLLAPRLLGYLGLIGPSVADRIGEAERTLRAAEAYGARAEWESVAEARRELETARRAAAAGDEHGARRAARRAGRSATEAQAAALVRAGQVEKRAEEIVEEVDGQVNDLEDMFETLPEGLPRERRSALLKRMREARRAAATVFLAHDEDRFADALAREQEARRALAETRRALEEAGARLPERPPSPPAAAPQALPSSGSRAAPGRPEALALPFESQGACPFECCTYRTWTVERDTDVRVARSKAAPVSFSLRRGAAVEALTGVVVVARPGRARSPRDAAFDGLALRAGEEVSVLHPVGEGFWLVWKDGRTASAPLNERAPAASAVAPELHLLLKPDFAWWIQVRSADGRLGWTDEPGNFGNKDRCA